MRSGRSWSRESGVTYDGTQEVPWENGRLLIDGEPFTFPTPDGWLG